MLTLWPAVRHAAYSKDVDLMTVCNHHVLQLDGFHYYIALAMLGCTVMQASFLLLQYQPKSDTM